MRTDRVVVTTGESTHLNCSVIGLGDDAQINCESHSGDGFPLSITLRWWSDQTTLAMLFRVAAVSSGESGVNHSRRAK
jgi:hypothetical protein